MKERIASSRKANRYEDAHSGWMIRTARAALRHYVGGAGDELLVARLQRPIANSERWLGGVWMEILRLSGNCQYWMVGTCSTDLQKVSLEDSIRVCMGENIIPHLVFLPA